MRIITAQRLPIVQKEVRREFDGATHVWVSTEDGRVVEPGTFRSVSAMRKHFGSDVAVAVHPECETRGQKKGRKREES